jgi:hypothetical protein
LYPPTWLVALLPMPWSADFLLIAHVLVAGLGAAALARRFGASGIGAGIAGSAFMLGGFVSSIVVHGGPLLTLAWTPWIVVAADTLAAAENARCRARRSLVLAALFALQLLAGDPSIAIMTGLLVVGVIVCRAPRRLVTLGAAAAAVIGAVVLAAVMIVPALALAGESTRSSGVSHELASVWSMHPLRVFEWIWPNLFGNANQPSEHVARIVANSAGATELGPSWALSLYISVPVIALAIVGWVHSERDVRRFAIVAGLCVLLALGAYTPLYAAYRAVFPPEHFVRYPEKYVGAAMLLLSAMAGVGWTRIAERGLSRRALIIGGAVLATFAVCVFAFAVTADGIASAFQADASRLEPPMDPFAWTAGAVPNGIGALVTACIVFAALVLAPRYPTRKRWIYLVGAGAFAGHLISIAWQVLPLFDRAIVNRPPAILAGADPSTAPRLYRSKRSFVLGNETVPERALSLYDSAVANTATRFGFAYLRGYDQAASARYEHAWTRYLSAAGERALDAYGIDLVIAPAPSDASYRLVPNEGRRPRGFVASRWRWFPTDDDALADLFGQSSLSTVRLTGSGTSGEGADVLQPCRVESPRPERVRLHCESSGGYAVLLDAWAPGWTASVDGVAARIERADGLVRAVAVPSGHHTIELAYRTPGLRTGALISLLGWLSLAALWVWLSRRRRAHSS